MAPLLPVLSLLAAGALHDTAPVQLVVTRDVGVEGCPDGPALERAVAARLGYSPFRAEAAARIEVRFGREREVTTAHVSRTEPGAAAASRDLSSRSPTCDDLAKSVELALTLAIDPLGGMQPAPPPPLPPLPPAPPPPAVAPVAPPPAPSPAAPAEPLELQLGLGGYGAWGAGPSLTGGGTVRAGLWAARFGLALEGRLEAPARGVAGGTSIVTQRVLGALLPCVRQGAGAGCVGVAAGFYAASSEGLSQPKTPATAMALVGAHFEYVFRLPAQLGLAAYAEVWVPFTRVTVAVAGQPVWTAPSFSADVGVQLRWSFR